MDLRTLAFVAAIGTEQAKPAWFVDPLFCRAGRLGVTVSSTSGLRGFDVRYLAVSTPPCNVLVHPPGALATARKHPGRNGDMTSTRVFHGTGSTLTVHVPPGSPEAVFMIEGLDNVASITLPFDEVRNLLAVLRCCSQAEPAPRDGELDYTERLSPLAQ